MRISETDQMRIRSEYATGAYSYAKLAQKYGVSRTQIGRIVNPEYQAREREKNRIRQRSYQAPTPAYSLNIRFTENETEILERVKSVPNKQQYVKDLIAADIERGKQKKR